MSRDDFEIDYDFLKVKDRKISLFVDMLIQIKQHNYVMALDAIPLRKMSRNYFEIEIIMIFLR